MFLDVSESNNQNPIPALCILLFAYLVAIPFKIINHIFPLFLRILE